MILIIILKVNMIFILLTFTIYISSFCAYTIVQCAVLDTNTNSFNFPQPTRLRFVDSPFGLDFVRLAYIAPTAPRLHGTALSFSFTKSLAIAHSRSHVT